MQGKVSMVVPCYNKEPYIGAMLDSVLAQEWDNIELILVNDGSTDGTRDVITEYLPKLSDRGYEVKLINQDNGGCCKAVHTGLVNMTGDYFCLVDADDEIEPQYVSKMAGFLDKHDDYQWAACNLRAVEKIDGTILEHPKPSRNPFSPGTDNMLTRYIFREMTTTVWIYLTRVSYLKKCGMIENFCAEHRRVYEPLIAVPLMAFGGKLKYFDEALYRYNVYASDLYGFDGFEKAKDYYDDYDYLYEWSISRLNISENEKHNYRSISKLIYYFELLAQLPQIIKRRGRQLAEQTIAEFNKLYNTEINLTATRFTEQGYKAFFASLSQALIMSGGAKWRRVIGYGALGTMAKYILPQLAGTAYYPTELWDEKGDGYNATIPDFESLSADDLILVFPKTESAVSEIKAILSGTPATVYYHHTIEYIISGTKFPQIKKALNISYSRACKPYGKGYVSGSFDLFHIGHLNLLRRAKEQCDYLVVGVLSDELILQRKGRLPVIPLADRMAIVKAISYVDEVDVTTPELIPRTAACEKYRFDAMFTGDDWGGDDEMEKKLNEMGADLVYFPYTKKISTSKLRESLNK